MVSGLWSACTMSEDGQSRDAHTEQHTAVPSALGYYYQAVYALRLLLLRGMDDAYVSVESTDDVYLESGSVRELHQLKHSNDPTSKIGIKSVGLWRTMTIWVEFGRAHGFRYGIYYLATVASIDPQSPLLCLTEDGSSRELLVDALTVEAQRVLDERAAAQEAGQPEEKWPHAKRYKGCEAFLSIPDSERLGFVQNIRAAPGSFQMANAVSEVSEFLRTTTPQQMLQPLAKALLAWWDREIVESMTGERKRSISLEEIRAFLARKTAELHESPFTDDSDTIDVGNPSASPELAFQHEVINASPSQLKRSARTEQRARVQRGRWLDNDVGVTAQIQRFDDRLIEEWGDRLEIGVDASQDAEKKREAGRALLDWSHFEAHTQIKPISSRYSDPDLIRGSFQMLSTESRIWWHVDYLALLAEAQKQKGRKRGGK